MKFGLLGLLTKFNYLLHFKLSITSLGFQLLSILDKETGEQVQTVQMRLLYNRYVSTKTEVFLCLINFFPTWA